MAGGSADAITPIGDEDGEEGIATIVRKALREELSLRVEQHPQEEGLVEQLRCMLREELDEHAVSLRSKLCGDVVGCLRTWQHDRPPERPARQSILGPKPPTSSPTMGATFARSKEENQEASVPDNAPAESSASRRMSFRAQTMPLTGRGSLAQIALSDLPGMNFPTKQEAVGKKTARISTVVPAEVPEEATLVAKDPASAVLACTEEKVVASRIEEESDFQALLPGEVGPVAKTDSDASLEMLDSENASLPGSQSPTSSRQFNKFTDDNRGSEHETDPGSASRRPQRKASGLDEMSRSRERKGSTDSTLRPNLSRGKTRRSVGKAELEHQWEEDEHLKKIDQVFGGNMRDPKHADKRKTLRDLHVAGLYEEHGRISLALDFIGGPAKSTWRLQLVHFVESTAFDATICGCVMLNAISIGVQCNWMVQNVQKEPPSEFRMIERVFFIVFISELSLRISIYGWRFFCIPEWRWNLFDTIVVGVQLMEELASIVTVLDGASAANLSFIRVIRILRLVRIVRLVRLLRFVEELRTLVYSILGSMRSLCWTLVLMLLMMYVVGVFVTQMIADSAQEDEEAVIMDEESTLSEYFGTLLRSVISLFQAMTGGVDWNDLLVPLWSDVSPWLAVLFLAYIAFAVLAMANVVTSVFVESALATAKADKEAQVITHVRHLFRFTDKDKTGTITWEEFSTELEKPGMDRYFQSLDIDIAEARGLFLLLDADESGTIDAEEFMQGVLRLRGPAKAIDLATLVYCNKRMMCWWQENILSVQNALEAIINTLPETELTDQQDGWPGDDDEGASETDQFHTQGERRQSVDTTQGEPHMSPQKSCGSGQGRKRRSNFFSMETARMPTLGTWTELKDRASELITSHTPTQRSSLNNKQNPRASTGSVHHKRTTFSELSNNNGDGS